jgi:hypothetical protein
MPTASLSRLHRGGIVIRNASSTLPHFTPQQPPPNKAGIMHANRQSDIAAKRKQNFGSRALTFINDTVGVRNDGAVNRVVGASPPAKRGRPPKPKNATTNVPLPLFDPSTPITEWSFTIGANGKDCPSRWLHRLHSWMEHNHLHGVCALERGSRNKNLHIQVAVRMPIGSTPADVARLKKDLKGFFPITTEDASKLQLKVFSEGQTWSHMMGYCQKDFGKMHYEMKSYLVSEVDLKEARSAYADIQPVCSDDRIVLYPKSLHDRILSYMTAHFAPFWIPVDLTLLFMMQTGRYVPGGDWIMAPRGYGADVRKLNIFMKMIMRPMQCTLNEVQSFFFIYTKLNFAAVTLLLRIQSQH